MILSHQPPCSTALVFPREGTESGSRLSWDERSGESGDRWKQALLCLTDGSPHGGLPCHAPVHISSSCSPSLTVLKQESDRILRCQQCDMDWTTTWSSRAMWLRVEFGTPTWEKTVDSLTADDNPPAGRQRRFQAYLHLLFHLPRARPSLSPPCPAPGLIPSGPE